MSSKDNGTDLAILLGAIFLGLVGFGIWRFSIAVGVDFNTSGITIFRFVGLTIGFVGLLYLSNKFFYRVKEVLLFYPPLFVYSLTPILNYKANHLVPEFMMNSSQLPWWGTSWGQFLVFLILELLMVAIWYFTRDE